MNLKPTIRDKTIDSWTDQQLDKLKKLYPTSDNKIISKKINKSVFAIRAKATLLKLKKVDRYWTSAQEKFVTKNWETLSPVEIGEKIKKTKWAVINKYRELKGLRKGYKKKL